MKARSLAIAVLCAASVQTSAFAGPNDFFGSQLSGGSMGGSPVVGGSPETPASDNPPPSAAGTPGTVGFAGQGQPPVGDYTVDEKRVQKKYKENMKRAQQLINRGQGMMKSNDDKVAKKGKVLKDIGDRALAELQTNNPFPELAAKDAKKVH